MNHSTLAKEILHKYWGYSAFREKQEEIILSILNGKDTLALLPTGGGKSICFQVPAMVMEGICIVVSPLIALIEDQVANLKKKGIKAIAISSAMSKREIDIALDNAAYGDYKFLYLSPERIETELFQERLKKMKVNLIAVDEAHCISQWGHDFRPAYLNIASIRGILNNTPFIALTATATKRVVDEIQQNLSFRENNVIQKSFYRKNLSYSVFHQEDVLDKLLRIIDSVKGSGIIYVGSRRKAKEISQFLTNHAISCTHYHAGLSYNERTNTQIRWLKNETRVIVATNAFGMGIDKPDVRFVIHLDLPDTLEGYFQEAGRAGRDQRKAYVVLLISPSMISQFHQKITKKFPSIETIKRTYQSLANFYQIPINSSSGQARDFDLKLFCSQYKLSSSETLNSLAFLKTEGYLELSEKFNSSSKLRILLSKNELYQFQLANKKYDFFIKTMLRTYGGLFDHYISIDEKELARNTQLNFSQVCASLNRLKELSIVDYIPRSTSPQVTFSLPRMELKSLIISKSYREKKNIAIDKMNAVIQYAENIGQCRQVFLLSYFGEPNINTCEACDLCLKNKKSTSKEFTLKQLQPAILNQIKMEQKTTLRELSLTLNKWDITEISNLLEFLIEQRVITTDGLHFFLRKN